MLVRLFIFYSITTPLISILHASLDLALHLMTLARPTYGLIGSIFFICGWAAQIAFWTNGDNPAMIELTVTPYARYQDDIDKDTHRNLIGVSRNLAHSKMASTSLILVL